MLLVRGGQGPGVLAQHRDGSPVRANQPQDGLDDGALSRAVLSHQARDPALGNLQGHVQGEVTVVFGQVFHRNHGHSSNSSSNSSRISDRVMPTALALSRARAKSSSTARRRASMARERLVGAT